MDKVINDRLQSALEGAASDLQAVLVPSRNTEDPFPYGSVILYAYYEVPGDSTFAIDYSAFLKDNGGQWWSMETKDVCAGEIEYQEVVNILNSNKVAHAFVMHQAYQVK